MSRVREQELWKRMDNALGSAYSQVWADSVVLAALGGRTVSEAIAAGISFKQIWLAVWEQLELSEKER